MFLAQLKIIQEMIKGDTSLQEKLKTAKSFDEVVSIAKAYSHEFKSVHLIQLSEMELKGVTGAYIVHT